MSTVALLQTIFQVWAGQNLIIDYTLSYNEIKPIRVVSR